MAVSGTYGTNAMDGTDGTDETYPECTVARKSTATGGQLTNNQRSFDRLGMTKKKVADATSPPSLRRKPDFLTLTFLFFMNVFFFRKKRPAATVAAIFGVALSSVLLLCGAGSVPVKNLLPQGTMQGDLDAGGHNLTNAATVSAANFVGNGSGLTNVQLQPWTTVNASMVNTTGTDGNPAFALVPGNNYVIDQVTNGPFELAVPDPTTATNLPIRLRDANNSVGASPYTMTDDAGGTGYGSLWYQSSETDLSTSGTTHLAIGGNQNYGEMVLTLGMDATPQDMWVANNADENARAQIGLGSSLSLSDNSSFSATGGSSLVLSGGVALTTGLGSGDILAVPTGTGSGYVYGGLGQGWMEPAQFFSTILWPSVGSNVQGSIAYNNGGLVAKLAGNTSTTKKFLSETGTGSAGAAPAWATIANSDLPEPVYAGSFSGTGSSTTSFTVTIGTTQAGTTYKVEVTPSTSVAAAPFYISAKTTTTFTVTYLTGLTGTVAFDWSVLP